MAEPLKDKFGEEMVHRLGRELVAVYPRFDVDTFTAQALDGYHDLELLPRCRHIAAAMADHLPHDQAEAIDIVVASLGPELENCDPADAAPTGIPEIDNNPMAGFYFMAHGHFLAEHVTGHFDQVMAANYEITKRATSEFSIRVPLRDHPDETLAYLHTWVHDPNVHVRRLVSEGTRPRLPWSFRLRQFQHDPTPVLELLEHLKDDPVEYVRRSVANNLNDIAKDHPDVVVEVARRWWADGDRVRRRLVRHALRTLVKAGHPDALAILGFAASDALAVEQAEITPAHAVIGEKVTVAISVQNTSDLPAKVMVDLRIHFVKSSGATSPKVFKGGTLSLEPAGVGTVTKQISVAQHTTRTHHPGVHRVEALLNGVAKPVGSFALSEEPT